MRLIICLLIISTYALGTSFSDPSRSVGPAVTVEIEHTHELVSEHHHHDLDEEDYHHDDHQNDEDKDHDSSAPHSHKVSISMSSSYFVTASQLTSFKTVSKIESVSFSIYDDLPPKSPILGSIFRPPIS